MADYSKNGPKGTQGTKLPVKTLCTTTPKSIPKPVATAMFQKGGSK